MKANELMIGDWVFLEGTPAKIRGVEIYCNNLYVKTNLKDTWHTSNFVEPIPLTPEILYKNGFETHPSNLRMFFEHDDYRLCYYINSSNHFSCFNNIDGSLVQKVIVYVHELQHALKLCGIDKEIVI